MSLVNESLEAAIARPRRSMLYMPGSNARALEKARALPADSLILDLEDAVAPEAKAGARRQVVEAVKAGGYGKREIVIRVNSLDTGWGHEDAPAVAQAGADAILLPKAESAAQVQHLEHLLALYGAPDGLALMCMIETPMGVLAAAEIARASPRLVALVMGTSDLAKELQAAHTRERLPLIASLGLCLLAARANRIAIVDGVHLDLDDAEGLDQACRQGRELGFDGKTLIHPKQIEPANRAFAPSAEDVAWSKRIIAAHAEADARGEGVALVDGKLIENLHVANARRVVALAERIAALDVAAPGGAT
jgi:citrate lyase subunit beta/citryl-CoA lyase